MPFPLAMLSTLALAAPQNLRTTPPDPVFELYQLEPDHWSGLLSGEIVFETDDQGYAFHDGVVIHHFADGPPVRFDIDRLDFLHNLSSWNLGTRVETTWPTRLFNAMIPNNRVVVMLPEMAAEVEFGSWINPDYAPIKIEVNLWLLADDTSLEELNFTFEPRLDHTELLYSFPVGPPDEEIDPHIDQQWKVIGHRTRTPWGGEPHVHRKSWVQDFMAGPDRPFYSTQRFALDTMLYNGDGNLKPGCEDEKKNECYLSWNAPISPIAAGRIVEVVNETEDNSSVGTMDSGIGNYILQELDSGLCVAYFHLKKGTARVSVGDYVVPGDVIGRVGNSGTSAEPHLHFDVTERYPGTDLYPTRCGDPAEAQTMYFDNITVEHVMGGSSIGYRGALSTWDSVFPIWPAP